MARSEESTLLGPITPALRVSLPVTAHHSNRPFPASPRRSRMVPGKTTTGSSATSGSLGQLFHAMFGRVWCLA